MHKILLLVLSLGTVTATLIMEDLYEGPCYGFSLLSLKQLSRYLDGHKPSLIVFDRALLVTAILESLEDPGFFFYYYVQFEQTLALLSQSKEEDEGLGLCRSFLTNSLVKYIREYKLSDENQKLSETKGVHEAISQGLSSLKDVPDANMAVHIEKLSAPLIGYHIWDPFRSYLLYRNTFSKKREQSFRETLNRVELHREVMRFRLELALHVLEDGDGSENMILSYFVSHYGFAMISTEIFRKPFNAPEPLPGVSGSIAELFAYVNLKEETVWLNLLRKMVDNCMTSSSSDLNKLVLSEIIEKQEKEAKKLTKITKGTAYAAAAGLGAVLLGAITLISNATGISVPIIDPHDVLHAGLGMIGVALIPFSQAFNFLFRRWLKTSIRHESKITGVTKCKTFMAKDIVNSETQTDEIQRPKTLNVWPILLAISVYVLVIAYIYRTP